jgi:hypothetical protein
MTRTIETDTTTSWALESPYMIDWLTTEDWEPILTEWGERIYAEQLVTTRGKENDTTTSWTVETNNITTSRIKETDTTTARTFI